MARDSRRRQAAFTLVELVVVIAIIGILAAIAIPRFVDLRAEAYRGQRDGIVGSVRAGIMLVASKNQVESSPQPTTFPPNLEEAWGSTPGGADSPGQDCIPDAGGGESPCFELVLIQPVSDNNWSQDTTTKYTFTDPIGAGTYSKTYTYDPNTGKLD